MKFNLLLLLLIILTAVTLSHQTKIKLSHFTGHNLSWALYNTRVILEPQGTNWTIVPCGDKDKFILPNGIPGKVVQYNGPNRQLTIEYFNGSPAQRWRFGLVPGFYESICPSEVPNMCAKAVGEFWWTVGASGLPNTNSHWWSRTLK